VSKSQHWYDRDGKAVFEVPKAKGGGTRPTTIADARKLNLYPSVTTVLSVLAKPSLDDWKLTQVAERAYSNPPQDGEDTATYSRRIINGAFEQVSDAADLGTRIHAAIEAHFKGEAVADEMQVYVKPVVGALERTGIKLLQHELRLVNTIDGYAGTTDAVMVLNGKHSRQGCDTHSVPLLVTKTSKSNQNNHAHHSISQFVRSEKRASTRRHSSCRLLWRRRHWHPTVRAVHAAPQSPPSIRAAE